MENFRCFRTRYSFCVTLFLFCGLLIIFHNFRSDKVIVFQQENTNNDDPLLVSIPSLGQIRGSEMKSSAGRNISVFRAIPYAKPPLGNLRLNVQCRSIDSLKLEEERKICCNQWLFPGACTGRAVERKDP